MRIFVDNAIWVYKSQDIHIFSKYYERFNLWYKMMMKYLCNFDFDCPLIWLRRYAWRSYLMETCCLVHRIGKTVWTIRRTIMSYVTESRARVHRVNFLLQSAETYLIYSQANSTPLIFYSKVISWRTIISKWYVQIPGSSYSFTSPRHGSAC